MRLLDDVVRGVAAHRPPPAARRVPPHRVRVLRRGRAGTAGGARAARQGADEDRPEGLAMAEWLVAEGVPRDVILVEDRARTTRENLALGCALLDDAGLTGPYLVATNSYHAPRAAMEAMDLGLDVHAIGAPTAGYFYPSAYLREFVAVLRRRPAVHVVVVTGIVLVSGLASVLTVLGT
ncbi:YdcF family protein [Isoptericola halotolerans]|uniref:YdcF family protein n=1 Tax=Isoptericola halotolerans TaxID=300560 RepID=UPI00388EEB10